jgi:hypothetical protein
VRDGTRHRLIHINLHALVRQSYSESECRGIVETLDPAAHYTKVFWALRDGQGATGQEVKL